MRHRKVKIHLGRKQAHRGLLLRNLATSLFLHESIETTVAKAKVLRPYAEKLISLARADSLAARRQAQSELTQKQAVKKLFEVIAPKFKSRPGGYTRIVRTRVRTGDSAELARISLVE